MRSEPPAPSSVIESRGPDDSNTALGQPTPCDPDHLIPDPGWSMIHTLELNPRTSHRLHVGC